jgi:hypothetical protein
LEARFCLLSFSNVQNLHIANFDKPIALYSLDVILAVGYRVKSLQATQFRQWATVVLHEYLQKGFVMNDEFLKNFGGVSLPYTPSVPDIPDKIPDKSEVYDKIPDKYTDMFGKSEKRILAQYLSLALNFCR